MRCVIRHGLNKKEKIYTTAVAEFIAEEDRTPRRLLRPELIQFVSAQNNSFPTPLCIILIFSASETWGQNVDADTIGKARKKSRKKEKKRVEKG